MDCGREEGFNSWRARRDVQYKSGNELLPLECQQYIGTHQTYFTGNIQYNS